jgi:hypothetical protein
MTGGVSREVEAQGWAVVRGAVDCMEKGCSPMIEQVGIGLV